MGFDNQTLTKYADFVERRLEEVPKDPQFKALKRGDPSLREFDYAINCCKERFNVPKAMLDALRSQVAQVLEQRKRLK